MLFRSRQIPFSEYKISPLSDIKDTAQFIEDLKEQCVKSKELANKVSNILYENILQKLFAVRHFELQNAGCMTF